VRVAGCIAGMVVALAAPARADDDDLEGAACVTSADCGELRCIDEACHDIAHLRAGDVPRWSVPIGERAMFGTGTGYGMIVAVADIVATLTEPFLMYGAVSSDGSTASTFGVLCFAPVTLTATTVHAIHGRAVPAVLSFFGWSSLAATTFVVGGLFGLAFENNGFEFNYAAAWAAGLLFGAGGAATLTWLDAWMARSVHLTKRAPSETSIRFMPSFAPTRGGATVSLGAAW